MKEKIMKLIADELGVEFGEVFGMKQFPKREFVINSEGIFFLSKSGFCLMGSEYDYMNYRKEDVIKKKWLPKFNDCYWYIDDKWICRDCFTNSFYDKLCFAFGDMFKTKQEAEEHRREFLDRLDRIMKGELVVKIEEV